MSEPEESAAEETGPGPGGLPEESPPDMVEMVNAAGTGTFMVEREYAESLGSDVQRLVMHGPNDPRREALRRNAQAAREREIAADSPLSAFFINAGDTAGFGVPAHIAREIVGGDQEDITRRLQILDQEQGAMSTLGVLAGMVPTLVAGGAGAARVSAATARFASGLGAGTMAANLAGRAAGSVAIDSILSPQVTMHDAAMMNEDLTAEMLLSNAGTDIGLGLAFEAVGAGGTALFRRLQRNAASRLLGEGGYEALAAARGADAAPLRPLSEMNPTQVREAIAETREMLGERLAAATDDATRASVREQIEQVARMGDSHAQGLGLIRDTQAQLRSAVRSVDNVLNAAPGRVDEILAESNYAPRETAETVFGGASGGIGAVAGDLPSRGEVAREMMGARLRGEEWRDITIEGIDAALRNPEMFPQMAETHGRMLDAFDDVSNIRTGDFSTVTDDLTAALFDNGVSMDDLSALVDDVGGRFERFDQVFGTAASTHNFSAVRETVKNLAPQMESIAAFTAARNSRPSLREQATRQLAVYATGAATSFVGMAAGGPLGGLLGGVFGRDVARRWLGQAGERATKGDLLMHQMQVSRRIRQAGDTLRRALGNPTLEQTQRVMHLGNSAFWQASNHDERMEHFAPVYERVRDLASNPSRLQQHLELQTGPIHEVDSRVGDSLGTAMVNQVLYLNEYLPQPFRTGFEDSVEDISVTQMESFMTRVGALEDPYGLLEQVAAGTLDAESVDAVRTVLPSVYTEMITDLAEILGSHEGAVPYHIRSGIATLTGSEYEPTRDPHFVMQLQSSAAQTSAQEQAVRGNPSQRRLAAAQNTMTPTQQIENL